MWIFTYIESHIDKKVFAELLFALLNELKKSHYNNKLLIDDLIKKPSSKKLRLDAIFQGVVPHEDFL